MTNLQISFLSKQSVGVSGTGLLVQKIQEMLCIRFISWTWDNVLVWLSELDLERVWKMGSQGWDGMAVMVQSQTKWPDTMPQPKFFTWLSPEHILILVESWERGYHCSSDEELGGAATRLGLCLSLCDGFIVLWGELLSEASSICL